MRDPLGARHVHHDSSARGAAPPLVFLQHFTGTLDNWDPAVTDALAMGREVILFESAGLGRSTGAVPVTISGMAAHFLAFADALGLTQVDLLGFSLGGMVAQQAALDRPSLVRKMLLVGTAPEAARISCTSRSRSSNGFSRIRTSRDCKCW